MPSLTQLDGVNAYKFSFDEDLLHELRLAFMGALSDSLVANPALLSGGHSGSVIGDALQKYFAVSYGQAPLLWISSDCQRTHDLFVRFCESLDIENEVKKLVDHDQRIVMYSGFFVVGNWIDRLTWHTDYCDGANAYTLLTPLFDLDPGHGGLLYLDRSLSMDDGRNPPAGTQQKKYTYRVGEGVLVGDRLWHCTEPYERTSDLRILLSLTLGTDKMAHWPALKRTVGSQTRFLIMPCGHRMGTCRCAPASAGATQR